MESKTPDLNMANNSKHNDPTENVLLLVEAAVKRLDDLHMAETKRIDQLLKTHFDYIEKLNSAEANRINAIRAVDVGAVAIASERASQQAIVLANQVSASAETLRSLVASTAATVAQQLNQVSSQLIDRIALLERSQYENKGKGAGINQFVGWIIAAIALVGFLFTWFVKKQ